MLLSRTGSRRCVPLVLVCGLLSACTGHLQKSFDRSVMIERQCNAIAEALPLEQQRLKDVLVNAVSVRLAGSCADGSQSCIESKPGEAGAPSLGGTMRSLRSKWDDTELAASRFKQVVSPKVAAAIGEFDSDRRQLQAEYDVAWKETEAALTELHKELRAIKETVSKPSLMDTACKRRTDCVRNFAQAVAHHQPLLSTKVQGLEAQIVRLVDIVRRTNLLLQHNAQVMRNVMAEAGVEGRTLMTEIEKLRLETEALAGHAKLFGARLTGGGRTLQGLFAPDVLDAATDLLAARLYEKGSERLLNVIDRLLYQLERNIDRIDDRAYGGATLVTHLFAGDIQEQFDKFFQQNVIKEFPNRTAQLAFTAAACKRLDPAEKNGVHTNSLFSPFLFASLIQLELQLRGEPGLTPKELRKEVEQRANDPRAEELTDEFRRMVTSALQKDAAPEKGAAPSVLQQVALCSAVEGELALSAALPVHQFRQAALNACGSAIVEAALASKPLAGAGTAAVAQAAVKAAPPLPAVPVHDNIAMTAALNAIAASMRSAPSDPLSALCQRILQQVSGSRCTHVAGGITVDLPGSFGLGSVVDQSLEIQLVQLADALDRESATYRLVIDAFASHRLPRCHAGSSTAAPAKCALARNEEIAWTRATWAHGVMRHRLGAKFRADNSFRGYANPLSFDSPVDRRVRITLYPH